MENKIECPRCGSMEIWKAGKATNGKQRYQCKKCKRKFITEIKYSEEFKKKAVQTYYEGNSGRAVGRLMKINKYTVYNWIKKLNKKIEKEKPEEENNKIEKVIEMDELYSYTKHKKTELT